MIYSMLSVPRNIAAAALSGHLATGKGGDAVAWQVYNELVKEWTTAYADKAKADQLVKDGYKVRPLYAALTGDCGGGDLEPIDCLEEAIALSASACYMEGVRAYYDTTWIEALVEAARRYLALTADNAKRGE